MYRARLQSGCQCARRRSAQAPRRRLRGRPRRRRHDPDARRQIGVRTHCVFIGAAGPGHASDHRPAPDRRVRLPAETQLHPQAHRVQPDRPDGSRPPRRWHPWGNAIFARSLGISADDPWILQEFVEGKEYCTHGTVRDGELQVYGCCESSAFQINYAHIDKPEILEWVERFVGALNVTGQLSFDFIEAADGHAYAIECNPRTHSAITMFYNHPGVAAAYLEDAHPMITPKPSAPPDILALPRSVATTDRAGPASALRDDSSRHRRHLHAVGSAAVLRRSPPADALVALAEPSRAGAAGRGWTSISASWSNRVATKRWATGAVCCISSDRRSTSSTPNSPRCTPATV